MIELSDLPENGKVLEVGCGTGQATGPMIDRGYHMTCLDIGENLLRIARNKFKGASVRFIKSSFEEWNSDLKFDLVMSATAWHWVDKNVGYKKTGQVLKDSGNIALMWNKHPTPISGFFEEVQPLYDKAFQRKSTFKPTKEWIQEQVQEVESSGYFTGVKVKEYPWSIRFKTQEYITLLNTFSDHIALPESKKSALYNGLIKVINGKYGGYIDARALIRNR
jgi:SAM-dependent methyltransferase